MNDERLETLLRETGRATAEPPPAETSLADRVRRLHVRRRHRRRIALGSIAAVAVLGVTFWGVLRSGAPIPVADRADPPRVSAADVEQLKAEIAAIDAEVEQSRRRIEQLRDRERMHTELAELLSRPQPPDPLETARMEIEKTALLLVDHADYQASSVGLEDVASLYRRVVNAFPHTRAAETAQRRLEQLSIREGEL